jgi:outer membrane protein OmpA-like peptidoglycan-associated protein
MSLGHPTYHRIASVALVLAILLVVSPVFMSAQDQTPPKAELFAGYQWLNPGGNVPRGTDASGNPLAFKLPSLPKGAGISFAYNFTKYWALEGDWGGNWSKFAHETTASIGPKLTYRTEEGVNFFAHTLLGVNRLTTSTPGVGPSNGIGAVLGGGMDLKLWKPITLRLFEADFVYARHNFSSVVPPTSGALRRPTYDGARLRTGLVFNLGGGAPEVSPAAACSVDRSEVLVGEPIHATVTPSNFNPKHPLTYNWSATGGKVEGKETGATIDTAGTAPGNYAVTAKVSDPKKTKGGEASCSSNFTVKPLNPPQISCSANPATVEIGTNSTVTCTCTSPDNVPVTVGGWTSTSGSLSGSGNSATLATAGASAGTATVNATCTDSRGLTTSASSAVALNNPPPPPPVVDKALEARLALHSVYFPTALPPVKDPNAGLVASQQEILATLANDFVKYREAKPDAHLILEGHADVRGSVPYNQALSERRVNRVKSFLVEHGVPEANIETKALGDQHNLTAAEVKASVEQNSELTREERARVLRNMKTIIWASNRRVDITLSTAGQTETSTRTYPFNATDSLTLIGGREAARKPAAAKKAPAEKKAPAKKK